LLLAEANNGRDHEDVRHESAFAGHAIFLPLVLSNGKKDFKVRPLQITTLMATEHPFQHLFETLGRVPASHAESVNRQAYDILSDILTVPVEKTGRCILLRAPRAGHGKTHLLARIQHQMAATHEFVALQASFGSRIDASSVMDDTLRRLIRQLPASGGLCILDLITRRLFSSALQPLVGSGEVPCQDREGALTALRTRPIETFDFHHPNAVTAHWARENFEVLGQRLSLELAQRSGLPMAGISFWVDTLFHFSSAPLDNSNRVRVLADAVHSGSGDEMERLEALLGLLTQLMRVVLVADDLEGFSADETAALRLAAFLGSLRQSVERLDVVLSLNQDIWESAFLPRLSGGLADRLSEVVVELEPLTEKEMSELLDSRVPGLGNRVLERIDVGAAGTHARGLIRAAGMAWLKATAMDSAAAEAAQSESLEVEFEVDHDPLPASQITAPRVSSIVASSAPDENLPAEPQVTIPEPATPAPQAPSTPVSSAIEAAAAAFAAAEPAQKAPVVVTPHEEPPAWPAPVFSAPDAQVSLEPGIVGVNQSESSPVQVAQESPIFHPPVSSPFELAPEPVAAEAVVFNPPGSSLFQAAQQAIIAQPPASDPSVSSPFEVSPEPPVFNPPASPPFQVSQEPPAFNPAVGSPFQAAPEPIVAEPPVFNPPASPPVQMRQEPPAFNPAVGSPFQAAPEPIAVEPPVFSPPASSPFQVAVEPPVFNPPVHSPFQASPASEPPVGVFTPPAWQQPAARVAEQAPAFQTSAPQAAASPFQIAAPDPHQPQQPVYSNAPSQVFQASPEPVFPPPAEPQAPPSTADTDRVDDLLRQFRERYGRGAL
jgi:hypothetical protein